MRKIIISAAALLSVFLSGCGMISVPETYPMPVDPYHPVNEEDLRFGECSISVGDEVNISGQGAWFGENDDIRITKGGTYNISGTLSGGISVDTDEPVKLVFVNADITNEKGSVVTSAAEKLIICSDGSSTLKGSGGDYGCAVHSDGSVVIAGTGSLSIDGGIFSRQNILFGRNVSTICEIAETADGEVITGTLYVN